MRVAAVAVVALAVVASAAADMGIVRVSPTAARPGTTVRVDVNGYLGPRPWPALPLVLVRADRMPRPYRCDGGTAICEPAVTRVRLARPPFRVVATVSKWRTDAAQSDHADGSVRFRVPALAPGRYVLVLWCDRCVRGPRGSLIANVAGHLKVRRAA